MVQTAAGSRLFIGTTAVNGLTDAYVEVGQITNLGMFGRSYEEIKYNAIGNRNVIKFKGQRDDGDIQLDLGRSAGDAGQNKIINALDDDHDYNFKVTLNDASTNTGATPTTFIFKAKVMSYQTTVGPANQVVAARTTLGITSGTIAETPAT